MKKNLTKPNAIYDSYERKPGKDKSNTHYCPGCGHGIIHNLIAEAIDDLEIGDRTVFISPVVPIPFNSICASCLYFSGFLQYKKPSFWAPINFSKIDRAFSEVCFLCSGS